MTRGHLCAGRCHPCVAPTHGVIPRTREAASPESIATNASDKLTTQDYGFRAPACGRPRNNRLRIAEQASSMGEKVIYGARSPMCGALPSMRCPTHGVIPRRRAAAEPGIHSHERLG